MGFAGIALYTARAAVFALAVGGLYALLCLVFRRKLRFARLAGLMYVAALVQITVLRGGVDWRALADGNRAFPQLIPLKTTLAEAKGGLWPLIYHTVGNLIWFVPLGVLLRSKKAGCALISGLLLSAGIELSQYLLMTGATDIDDVILNALGALAGWALAHIIKKDGFA